jgi:predicted nucleic acid-binding protein
MERLPHLLLDTTVYTDDFQNKLPTHLDPVVLAGTVWHSSVTACELSVIAGLLDPKHPNSAAIVEKVIASIEKRSHLRTINPDPDTWIEAGILAGLLARLQQYGKQEQRRVLNDALIFLSASKAGLTVLTRNAVDYDLLMQLAPQGQAVFYKI